MRKLTVLVEIGNYRKTDLNVNRNVEISRWRKIDFVFKGFDVRIIIKAKYFW